MADRSRAVHVSGHHQRALALLAQVVGQLGRGSCFTRTLQANQHDNCRRCATQVELVLSLGSSQHFYQFFIDDSQDLLCWREAAQYISSDSLLPDSLDILATHLSAYSNLQ